MSTVLIAGASGSLGRYVVAQFRRAGYTVRALARTPAPVAWLDQRPDEIRLCDLTLPSTLDGVCDGVDVVFSCAGARMALDGVGDRRGFLEVDYRGNLNLLAEARAAGVRKFVYVSLCGAQELRHTEYADAHERVVEALRASGLEYTVIRPTGFFSFFATLLPMARRGALAVVGPGTARTNPIHEADLARICVEAAEGDAREVDVGGPEVLSRREIAELALRAVGSRAAPRGVPAWLARALAAAARPINRRIHALLHFGLEVQLRDVLAPAHGTRSFRAYLNDAARGA